MVKILAVGHIFQSVKKLNETEVVLVKIFCTYYIQMIVHHTY